MKSLGSTLKKTRELMNLTLKDVEKATKISNAYLSQVENDKIKQPSASVLYKLAAVYKLELNDLLEASGIVKKQEKSEKAVSNEWVKRLAFYTDDLDTEQKEEVLKYIKYVKQQK
jgi:transcriptional regulator with XRE-family HTH domain